MSAPSMSPVIGVRAIESVPIADVYAVCGSSPGGLTSDEAETRLRESGPNVLAMARPRPFLVRFGAHFTHLMALLLWAGSLLAVLAGLGVLSVAIVMVNVINGVFSFWQEHKADRATEALRQLLPRVRPCAARRSRGAGARRATRPRRRDPARRGRSHLGGRSRRRTRRAAHRPVDAHGRDDPGPQDRRAGTLGRRQQGGHTQLGVRRHQRVRGPRQGRRHRHGDGHRVRSHRRADPGDDEPTEPAPAGAQDAEHGRQHHRRRRRIVPRDRRARARRHGPHRGPGVRAGDDRRLRPRGAPADGDVVARHGHPADGRAQGAGEAAVGGGDAWDRPR